MPRRARRARAPAPAVPPSPPLPPSAILINTHISGLPPPPVPSVPPSVILINPHMFPGIEDARDSPSIWNTHWEGFYRSYPYLIEPRNALDLACAHKKLDGTAHSSNPSGGDRYGYVREYESTCEIRHRVGAKAAEAFAQDDLEERWVAAPASTRRRHALVAMAGIAAQAKYLNIARCYCADILHTEFLGNNGKVLLTMLKLIIPNDISVVPTELYDFAERRWDALRAQFARDANAPNFEKSVLSEVLLHRTKLIYLVAEAMLDSFYGRPLQQVTIRKQHDFRTKTEKKTHKDMLQRQMRTVYGMQQGDRLYKHELAATREQRSEAKITCETCGKAKEEGDKMSRCAKCWRTIQREVFYCSKECQTNDWTARHKRVCGQTIASAEDAVRVAVPKMLLEKPLTRQTGPAVAGFKRSPLLVWHIRRLDMEPELDFIVRMRPGPLAENSGTFRVRSPLAIPIFRAAREKAMTMGDRMSVVMLCHYLVWFVTVMYMDELNDIDVEAMVRHISDEFEYPELREDLVKLDDEMSKGEHVNP
ncbi:hypothetical protein BDW22DRAFT_1430272 [Trametopsis cervina]|nr:hypothetical protein BDW22DRAFT_1430272 [Trametopsis cervina]